MPHLRLFPHRGLAEGVAQRLSLDEEAHDVCHHPLAGCRRRADPASREFDVVTFTEDGLTLFVGAQSSMVSPRPGNVLVY